ncbi:MAG TPA: hypothetical protein VES42_06135 [Pilimelia sp.]|nr:hypothetical protein [Pilimelia sp.]
MPWEPTPEQQRLLDEAAAHFRRADDHERLGWVAVAETVASGVPLEAIVEHVPRGPAAVSRHLAPAASDAARAAHP